MQPRIGKLKEHLLAWGLFIFAVLFLLLLGILAYGTFREGLNNREKFFFISILAVGLFTGLYEKVQSRLLKKLLILAVIPFAFSLLIVIIAAFIGNIEWYLVCSFPLPILPLSQFWNDPGLVEAWCTR